MNPIAAPLPVTANRPAPIAAQLAIADQQSWQRALTLSDMEDPPPVSSTDSTAHDDLAIEKEDKYLRRPPLKSFRQTAKRDLKNMPSDLWRDTKRVYANPVNLVLLGTAYGGSLAI